jgi:O-antigen ligase
LLKFNRMVAWTGIAATFFHLLSPIVIDEYITSGRFHSYGDAATGFAVVYALVVVAMFWMGLAEKNKLIKWIFQLAALVGIGLILWSGSRSPAGAMIVAIGLLWWVFRTPIFLYVLLFTMIGLTIQVIGLSEQEGFGLIADRVEGTGIESLENSRLRIWEGYFQLIFQSPIYGYSTSGLMTEFYSDEQLEMLGTDRYAVKYSAAHNSYIGFAARFGFVGVGIFCSLILMSLRRAKTVLLSKFVPEEQKHIYVLPVAMLIILCITCLTEDTVPGNGKGNTPTLMMFMLMYLCEFVGRKLLHQYPDRELEENEEIYQQSNAPPEENSSGSLIAQRKRGYLKTSR